MKLVVPDTLFEPPQLFRTNASAIGKHISTQRDFIPMLILGRKVNAVKFKVQNFSSAKLKLMREQSFGAISSAFQT
jgi:hypothetical protein